MELRLDGREQVLRGGEGRRADGRPHAQRPYRDEPFHVRVQWRPPANAEAFGEGSPRCRATAA